MNREKKDLMDMMSKALKVEHKARILDQAQTELVKKIKVENFIEQLQEISGDGKKTKQNKKDQ